MNEDVIEFIEVADIFTGEGRINTCDRSGGMVEQKEQLDE
jgi:hypothetical protein